MEFSSLDYFMFVKVVRVEFNLNYLIFYCNDGYAYGVLVYANNKPLTRVRFILRSNFTRCLLNRKIYTFRVERWGSKIKAIIVTEAGYSAYKFCFDVTDLGGVGFHANIRLIQLKYIDEVFRYKRFMCR